MSTDVADLEVAALAQRPQSAVGDETQDLSAERRAARVRIAARFALDPGGDLLQPTLRRLVTPDDEREPVDARLIVVPDKAQIATADEGEPAVIRFQHLRDALRARRR